MAMSRPAPLLVQAAAFCDDAGVAKNATDPNRASGASAGPRRRPALRSVRYVEETGSGVLGLGLCGTLAAPRTSTDRHGSWPHRGQRQPSGGLCRRTMSQRRGPLLWRLRARFATTSGLPTGLTPTSTTAQASRRWRFFVRGDRRAHKSKILIANRGSASTRPTVRSIPTPTATRCMSPGRSTRLARQNQSHNVIDKIVDAVKPAPGASRLWLPVLRTCLRRSEADRAALARDRGDGRQDLEEIAQAAASRPCRAIRV